MVSASIEWNKENVNRYVNYTLLGKNKKAKPLIIVYGVLLALLAVAGVVFSVITGYYILALFSVLAVALVAIFAVVLKYAIVKYSADILELNTENKINEIDITENGFIMKNSGIPFAVVGWESATSLDFYGDDAYITMINGLLFIIEKDKLTAGDFEQLGGLAAANMVKQDD
ncbi:MAG: hypothetical protein J1E39_00320 [Eubacterium sp.]|nr:hypothetical protein [Eubacterium sp.]